MAGATAPVTLRMVIVQHCAENLCGVTIHQLAAPGSPIVYGGAPAAFDMRRGSAPMGAIETAMLHAGYAEIGAHLRLPVHGYLVVSDAKCADYQAGAESALGALSELSWAGKLTERGSHGDWSAAGAPWAHRRAADEVRRLLDDAQPMPLDDAVAAELEAIMRAEGGPIRWRLEGG